MTENNNNDDNDNSTETVVVTVEEEKKFITNEPDSEPEPKPQRKMRLKSIKVRHTMLPLALVTFLLSIPFLFQAIWLLYVQQYDCEGLLKTLPKLQLGIVIGLIVVFLVSNGVVYSRARFLAPGLIIVTILLVLMFIVGLTLRGSFNTDNRQIPGSPRWLRMKVHGDYNWNNIKSCLFYTRTCRDLVSRSYNLKPYDYATGTLSPIESGCCSPPSICEMEYVNVTYWRKSNKEMTDINIPYDGDCDTWQNDETMLCYDCHACKEGFVTTLEGKWYKLGTFLIVMSLLLMISHLLLFVAKMWEQHFGA
ncbi:hypothetical protein BUALT_Bualt16G0095800 [Buddleja alternifolia]|uniref:Tetraspanin n=1 Tax=Buddleja alternifolia TaxID=168488 RepID=A0AAV6WGR6_9LAMI|nr:hypothetical protein BUALT_Bualt16G0095800 [Buddleja alternifolia]